MFVWTYFFSTVGLFVCWDFSSTRGRESGLIDWSSVVGSAWFGGKVGLLMVGAQLHPFIPYLEGIRHEYRCSPLSRPDGLPCVDSLRGGPRSVGDADEGGCEPVLPSLHGCVVPAHALAWLGVDQC